MKTRHSASPRYFKIFALLCIAVSLASGQEPHPGKSWERLREPEKLGWSREKLKAARDFTTNIQTAAVMIVVHGQVLDEWGQTTNRFNIHSIRKSLLSAMYGIHVGEGHVNLAATMAELGIDDNAPALSALEKSATVHDLLKARSGVYHPALYETASMKAARPARGSHAPNTFWYYNNWDFNVLGTIFEQQTKAKIFPEFKVRIADPIGMEDFRLEDGSYFTGEDSTHPAYPFRMTARDMARFGLLFLHHGEWNGKQVIPRAWVKESTASYSNAGNAGGYGYLWWVAVDGKHFANVTVPAGTFSARGAHGHYILVVPALDLVVVHRVNTDIPGHEVTGTQFGDLVRLILSARQAEM